MRQFTAKNLKQMYIQGELDPFCEVLDIDADEFDAAEGHELYFIMDREIKELKEKGIFENWV